MAAAETYCNENCIPKKLESTGFTRLHTIMSVALMPPSSPSRPTNPSQVSGNAPDSIKQFLLHSLDAPKRMPVFAPHIHLGLVLSEVSIYPAPEDPLNQQMRVVLRIEVDESMLDLADSVFGGCIAYLIDYCSSLSVAALRTAFLGDSSVNVSQSLAIAYHAQAMCGDKLRIVNTSVISTGGDNGSPPMAMNAKAEIWEETRHRLLASGIHNLMKPSPRSIQQVKSAKL